MNPRSPDAPVRRALAPAALALALAWTANAFADACDRQCLRAAADSYLLALALKTPGKLPTAPQARFTENNVPLALGSALWQSVSQVGDQPMHVLDTQSQQVALLVRVDEGGRAALLGARLRLRDRRVAELETVVARKESSTFLSAEGVAAGASAMEAVLAPSQRSSRKQLIAIADGYFRGLVDPAAAAPAFDPACNRIENGVQTTNQPSVAGQSGGAINASPGSLGCLEQFRTGSLTFVSRLRAVSYPVVDVEAGLVYATVIMDHDGLDRPSSGSGVRLSSRLPSPYSFAVGEVFKIVDARITRIYAVLSSLPYGSASPWTKDTAAARIP